ncbi:MAG: hypothetical protein CMB56_001030 [Methanobacteriota archaeon]|nr:MAG: hypothetical protein CMB56_001030 [Euryarchaeota archaeon]|tara:strand:- start:928 stop:1911 length:984 start_codon:yes stop_codon:yes gene_type:complete
MPKIRAELLKKYCIFFVVFIFISSGCISDNNTNKSAEDNNLDTPTWEVGNWWMYTFTTPEFGDVTTRLVVTESDAEDNTSYMLGITNQLEAHRHALLNFNPFLGRITHTNLSVFENGVPQSVFSFPLIQGNSWTFDLFGYIGWKANLLSINEGMAYIIAENEEGGILEYTYDSNIKFISKLIWKDNSDIVKLDMMWSGQNGEDYSGDAYFVRAFDLRDEIYEGNDGEIYESTFLNNGHPSDGDFDQLYIYLDVEIDSSASSHATFTIKDRAGISPKVETWNAGTSEKGSISVIPSQSGEYTLSVTCTGSSSYIHMIVVGGLESVWTL